MQRNGQLERRECVGSFRVWVRRETPSCYVFWLVASCCVFQNESTSSLFSNLANQSVPPGVTKFLNNSYTLLFFICPNKSSYIRSVTRIKSAIQAKIRSFRDSFLHVEMQSMSSSTLQEHKYAFETSNDSGILIYDFELEQCWTDKNNNRPCSIQFHHVDH